MKFLCTHCDGLTVPRDFRIEGETLVVVCRGCLKESRLVRPPASGLTLHPPLPNKISHPMEIPKNLCPKCLGPRADGAVTCRHCGLVFDNFASVNFELSPDAEQLWQETLQKGDDEAAHRALVQYAQNAGELPQVVRLYRLRLAHNPEDAVAARWVEEVMRTVAAVPLAATASALAPVSASGKIVATLIALAVFILFAVLFFHQMRTLSR